MAYNAITIHPPKSDSKVDAKLFRGLRHRIGSFGSTPFVGSIECNGRRKRAATLGSARSVEQLRSSTSNPQSIRKGT
jgi:hypothetical protein